MGVEPEAPMSMNERSLFMVWNRKSKNGSAIVCPIIRAELLSFVSMGR